MRGPCSEDLRLMGQPYPRTCPTCGLGPCRERAPFEKAERPPEPDSMKREALAVANAYQRGFAAGQAAAKAGKGQFPTSADRIAYGATSPSAVVEAPADWERIAGVQSDKLLHCIEERDAAQADAARLRKALERISAACTPLASEDGLLRIIADIASKALAESATTGEERRDG